jgi:hypothetical protein
MSEFIPDPVSVEVGARIRKVRHARGLTLEDVQRGKHLHRVGDGRLRARVPDAVTSPSL